MVTKNTKIVREWQLWKFKICQGLMITFAGQLRKHTEWLINQEVTKHRELGNLDKVKKGL
jgi:hypothetical protein